MTARERARAVRALRRAAEGDNRDRYSMGSLLATRSSRRSAFYVAREACLEFVGEHDYYDYEAHPVAQLALLFVAAAVEAGDWP